MNQETFIELSKSKLESVIAQDPESKEIKIYSKFGDYDQLEKIMNSENNKIEYLSGLVPLKTKNSKITYSFYYHLILINNRFGFHALHSLNLPGARKIFQMLKNQDKIIFDLAAIKKSGFLIKTTNFISIEIENNLDIEFLESLNINFIYVNKNQKSQEYQDIMFLILNMETKELYELIKNKEPSIKYRTIENLKDEEINFIKTSEAFDQYIFLNKTDLILGFTNYLFLYNNFNEILGFINFRLLESESYFKESILDIQYIFTKPSQRNIGVASDLIENLKTIAIKTSVNKIVLGIFKDDKNIEELKEIYIRIGFNYIYEGDENYIYALNI